MEPKTWCNPDNTLACQLALLALRQAAFAVLDTEPHAAWQYAWAFVPGQVLGRN